MKRFALLMGIAVMAFTSCLKDTVTETNNGRPIDFHVSAQTRAVETTTGNLTTFYVTSLLENGTPYFEDIAFIRGTDNVFMSTPSYYWPIGSLNFFAYAPAEDELGGTLTITNSEMTLKGFSPAEEIADQKDFIVASATGNKTENSNGVALTFDHMLSQIEVSAKNAREDYVYLIKGVSIENVVACADFDFTTSTSTWTPTKGDDGKNVLGTYTIEYYTPIELTEFGTSVMNKVTIEGVELSDNAMLIPQNLSEVAPDACIKLLVQCKAKPSGAQIFPDTQDEYGWIEGKIDTNWEAGYKYVYTVDFTDGADNFEDISFTMYVDPWDEGSTKEVEEEDVIGTWRMARMEVTETYPDGSVEKYIYDTENEILEHLNDDLYVVTVATEQDYYTYPGTDQQGHYYYIIENGELKVQFEEGGDLVAGFFIRDISENFVTYSKVQEFKDGEGKVYETEECVFYYVRIEDIPIIDIPEVGDENGEGTGGDNGEGNGDGIDDDETN